MTGTGRRIVVRRPGALTTVQDGGRPGLAHLGVPRSGALDVGAHRRANRLVGNDPSVPVLETTLDGVSLCFTAGAVVAVTGAVAPVSVDGRPAGWSVPLAVAPGQTLEVGRAVQGVRCYVAVGGGIATDVVLGSSSRDLLAGLGPLPLAAGDVLGFGPHDGRFVPVDMAPYPLPPDGTTELVLWPGPRRDWLSDAGLATLAGGRWTVSSESNRIALRLVGPPVERSRDDELPSEGIVLGSIQSLPDGGLVVFLADHPTTGGYPVVAVVDPRCLDACAQARPGTTVTFRLR